VYKDRPHNAVQVDDHMERTYELFEQNEELLNLKVGITVVIAVI